MILKVIYMIQLVISFVKPLLDVSSSYYMRIYFKNFVFQRKWFQYILF